MRLVPSLRLAFAVVALGVSACGGGGGGGSAAGGATLSALSLSAGTLSPAFSPSVTAYTASVGLFGVSLQVTPTTSDPAATVTVNGAAVASASTSGLIPLAANPTPTPIDVAVTLGAAVTHYSIVVTRAATAAQEAYVKAANGETQDSLGSSVGISGDTLVVGAPFEKGSATTVNGTPDNAASTSGAAYVFVRSGGVWTQQAYLKPFNTGPGDQFGLAVAISGDTIVVGAPFEDGSARTVNGADDNAASNAGAAYVFVRNAGVWAQQSYLKASNAGAGDNFGASVAVSGDTVVVGASIEDGSATGVNGADDDAATNAGAAYVFVRNAGVWSQQAYLKASNTDPDDGFGISVTVSGDTVVVGANGEDGSATTVNGPDDDTLVTAGAAYVFVRIGGTWTQQAYLKPANAGLGDQFGNAVALAGDTLVVGAQQERGSTTTVNGPVDDAALGAGAAYVFVRNAGVWSQQAYLKASNTEVNDFFGCAVAISGDTVAVGALGEDGGGFGIDPADDNAAGLAGTAFVFTRTAGVWSLRAHVKASNTDADDRLGTSIAVSGDTVVAGAPREDGNATTVNGADNDAAADAGAGYVLR